MVINIRSNLDFLDFDDLLLLARLIRLFLLLVFVLPVIQDLADRRHSIGRDFHQVQAEIISADQRFAGGHDT